MNSYAYNGGFYLITNHYLNLVFWGGFVPDFLYKQLKQFLSVKILFPDLPYQQIENINDYDNHLQIDTNLQGIAFNLRVKSIFIDEEKFYFFNFTTNPEQISLQEANFSFVTQFFLKGREAEKAYITRELHDGLGQLITALKIKLSIFERYYKIKDVEAEFSSVNNLVDTIQKEMRNILLQMNASCLELSLVDSLEMLVKQFENSYPNIKVDFQVALSKQVVLEKNTELNLYRIIQEALNNCFKHSKADTIRLYLGDSDNRLIVFIDDNGTGFEKEKVKKGYGLKNIESRAKLINAEICLETDQSGTSWLISIPYQYL